jgi:hypothetical protein
MFIYYIMDNTVSWCAIDIFEYVIKFDNNKITCSKSTGESSQEIDGVA